MRNADSKNELRLNIKLNSKRDSTASEKKEENFQIMEDDPAQIF
jgi:Tfp pilus assembly ATPase PilU